MLNELKQALNGYSEKWQNLVASVNQPDFFKGLKPVAVGWKVKDANEYDTLYQELRPHCDRIVETYMNGRWIAKMHFKNSTLPQGISIVKLMQRRPDSTDPAGLDHVDFYSPKVVNAEEVLKNEPNLKWSSENNDVMAGYEWVSLWFDGTEAKLKSDTVIDIITKELQQINDHIKSAGSDLA